MASSEPGTGRASGPPGPDSETVRLRIVRRELTIGAGIVAIGLLLLLVIVPLGVPVPGHLSKSATSPAMWPRAASVLLTAAGLVYILLVLLDKYRGGPAPDSPPEPIIADWSTVAAMAALPVLLALFPILGLPLTSGLALAGYAVLMGGRRPWPVVALAILVPTALYLFFTRVANIPIPMGTLVG